MRKTHVRFCERADAGLITRRHPTRLHFGEDRTWDVGAMLLCEG